MSDQPKISGIKACVFDAYGTLFDVHSAVGKHREQLGDIADNVSARRLRSRIYLNCRNCWND